MQKILKHALVIMFFTSNNICNAQAIKVAILDFENTSGKTEYDALGKAISSMLITDLANNIHPKKVEFFERSQLNKLLDEQKLQKSKDFDAKTAVDFGKLSGVNYVFVGSVFVLDDLVISSVNISQIPTLELGEVINIDQLVQDAYPLDNLEIRQKLSNAIVTLNESRGKQVLMLSEGSDFTDKLIVKYVIEKEQIKIKCHIVKKMESFS